MYYGYYRESAKYKTEWFCVAKSEWRPEVARKLRQMTAIDRAKGHYGSRTKIVKKQTTKETNNA